MPRASEMYPSRWMAAADLLDQDLTLTIDRIETQVIKDFDGGDTEKWVLFFREEDKGLVLNKTNTKVIAGLYGDETEDWRGQRVTLYPTWVDFQGRSVEAIRVRPKPPRTPKAVTTRPERASKTTRPEPGLMPAVPAPDNLDLDDTPF